MFGKEYTLVADIGGTNSRIALYDGLNFISKKEYSTYEFTNVTDILKKFLSELDKKYKIIIASIAIAGVVENNTAKLTNIEVSADTSHISLNTGIKKVVLLNDFEALGYSIDSLKEEDYVEITNLGRNKNGTIAVIGAGTGLGATIAPLINSIHVPISSQAGKIDLGADLSDLKEVELYKYLIKKKLYFDIEDLVSGRGIVNIYNFLLQKKVKHSKNAKTEIKNSSNKPQAITKHALLGEDALSVYCLEIFIHQYAKAARNLVLTSKCSELFIAGGIAPKILPALKEEFFEELIKHKNLKMHELLENTPVFVIINPNASLIGCINALKHKS